jgi:hypothetical protein
MVDPMHATDARASDQRESYSICSAEVSSIGSGAGASGSAVRRVRRVVPVRVPLVPVLRGAPRVADFAAVRRVVPVFFAAVLRVAVPVALVELFRAVVFRAGAAFRAVVLRPVVFRAVVFRAAVLRVPVARVDRVPVLRVPVLRAEAPRAAVLRVVVFFAAAPRFGAAFRVAVFAAPRVVFRAAVLRVPVPRVVRVDVRRVPARIAIGWARGFSVVVSSLTDRNSFSCL